MFQARQHAAMLFALSAVGLVTASGAGIDFARAMTVKSRLAEALDAAARRRNHQWPVATQVQAMWRRNISTPIIPPASGAPLQPVQVSISGQTISLAVTGVIPTTLLKVANIDNLTLKVANQVVRAVTKLRVALVLDNTGSMTETDNTGTSKISALKTATTQLIAQLQNAAVNPGDVQVGIIPFEGRE